MERCLRISISSYLVGLLPCVLLYHHLQLFAKNMISLVFDFCDLMLFHHSPESLSMGCLFIVTGSRLLLRILYIL